MADDSRIIAFVTVTWSLVVVHFELDLRPDQQILIVMI